MIVSQPATRLSRRFALLLAACLASCAMSACQPLGYEQMTAVSKDWCLSMRANQLVPVYPLTEDLQPGDVFLVQTSIGNQQSVYEDKGFLPLDDHQHRISLSDSTTQPYEGVNDLYFDGYFKDTFGGTNVPHPRPDRNTNAGAISPSTQPSPIFTEIPAPRVVFPSYSFEVDRGSGLSLAIPIHGIATGLNFMQADKAVATVTLLDAHTYAADTYYLDDQLQQWASSPNVRSALVGAVAANNGSTVYLRVVSRVYLVGGMSVSLTNASSSGGNLSVGNVKPPSVVNENGTANENYTQLLDALTAEANGNSTTNPSTQSSAAAQTLSSAASQVKGLASIGGAVQFTQASTLGVTLNQIFDHPLVVGYLGFDVAVLKDGRLGPRVPTFDVLEKRITPAALPLNQFTDEQLHDAVVHQAFQSLETSNEPKDIQRMLSIISAVGKAISDDPFPALSQKADVLLGQMATPPTNFTAKVKNLGDAFQNAWTLYDSTSTSMDDHYERFWKAFDAAYAGVANNP